MGAFDAIMATVDYPMYVVTTVDRSSVRARAGCLVGFATQCSIDPARFLVGLSKANRTYRVALDADVLAVHLLAPAQCGLAELFGGETGDEVDKFSQCAWEDGPLGVPVLVEAPAWFAGRVVDCVDLGDHVGFVIEPFDGWVDDAGSGPYLTFHAARTIDPGHPA